MSATDTRLERILRDPMAWVDVGLALALAVAASVLPSPEHARDVAFTVLLVALPIAVRRRWPVEVLVIVAVGVVGTRAAVTAVDVAAVAVAGFSVGDRDGNRTFSAAWILAVALSIALVIAAEGAELLVAITVPFVILVPAWIVGDLFRGRRAAVASQAAAILRLERERAAALELALTEERRRVARDLHDVVAHSVSVMLVQTGAARQLVRQSPDRAEAALLTVEATGRDAMTELRRLLGALGSDGDQPDGGIAPQPGLAQLPMLVARVHDAGLPARLEVEGDERAMPPSIDVGAYRIAQEALTNALRHAGPSNTLVHVVYEPMQLRLEILDSGPGPSSNAVPGRGIAGMQERAALAGGHLEAGPRIGGGFGVRAWFPIPPPSP